MFIELKNEELVELDGGGKASLVKDIFMGVLVNGIYDGGKAAYNELTNPSHYAGKADYRTWYK